MGNNSQKTISSAGQGSEPLGSGQCANWDNEKQRPLAEGEVEGETPTSMDCGGSGKIETYHKGYLRGWWLGCKQMKDFYEAKIVVLEKQVEHWKELAKR